MDLWSFLVHDLQEPYPSVTVERPAPPYSLEMLAIHLIQALTMGDLQFKCSMWALFLKILL